MKLRKTTALLRAGLVTTLCATAPNPASAEGNSCRVVEAEFNPSDKLQIVAWIEDTAGNYIDTIYLTQAVGTYGIGNRPGVLEFNSGPKWPYGRREMVFPVWAHRHPHEFPLVMFQNSGAVNDANDRNLSHPFNDSSREVHFCRPIAKSEPSWDTGTCASQAYTDKGTFHNTLKSKYPPREDLSKTPQDSPSVSMFAQMNPFDSVTQATPMGGVDLRLNWTIPPTIAKGNYVLFVETSKEFDHNAFYTTAKYPGPAPIPWSEYGEPFRGQPSVIYKVPFTIGDQPTTAVTADYAGYGAVNGEDGDIRPPDNTISTTTPGSGAARFALTSKDALTYRLRVNARNESDSLLPGAPSEGQVIGADSNSVTLSFVAPGDDGMTGRKVSGYEIRIRAGEPITAENFASSMPVPVTVIPDDPGQVQTLDLSGLLPVTEYYVGIKAFDDCRNESLLTVMTFKTSDRTFGEVDACFVATAAYGSLMANDVELLRHFRDSALRKTVLGELFVETYYTFGPAVAGVVGESDTLRATARTALSPVIDWVKKFKL